MPEKIKEKISVFAELEANIAYVSRELGLEISFDVILREFKIGHK